MKIGFHAILLFIIIACAYSNTLDSAWQFDDIPNIVNNTALHIENITPESLWKASFSRDRHYNYRPFPNLTFGINWYFGKDNTRGYHIVNILVHVVTACLLLFTTRAIFDTRNLRNKYSQSEVCFISLLATALWVLHPIQTQAVTYIVQRMTSMAAMFYIASIFFYVKGRNQILQNLILSPEIESNKDDDILITGNKGETQSFFFKDLRSIDWGSWKILFYFFLCLFSYVCAFFSKENAAILPLLIIVVEVLFYRDLSRIKINWKYLAGFVLFFVVVAIMGIFFFAKGDFLFFIERYNYRPFSIWERLLTEPRIVMYYISQIFYPLSERFSITHDVVISKNLFHPWTTIASGLTILMIMSLGLFQAKKTPLLAFAIFFYFFNHIIESTIIPLELVFEHRNYLPSMFLFLPAAWAANDSLKRFKGKNNIIYLLFVITVPLVLIWLGMNTYTRNSVWKTELSLWYDAYKKAPNDARAVSSLALRLAFRNNPSARDYDVALNLFERALSLSKSRKTMNAEIYGNIAGLYYNRKMLVKAIEFHRKSLEVNPDFIKGRFDLAKTLIMMGLWDEASKEMDIILASKKDYLIVDFFKVKGHILLWQRRPEEALEYFRKVYHMAPWNQDVFFEIGTALSMAGHFWNAEWFLKSYFKRNPKNIFVSFCLIENRVKGGDMASAEKISENLLANNDIDSIYSTLRELPTLYRFVPVSADIIEPVITKKIMEFASQNDSIKTNSLLPTSSF